MKMFKKVTAFFLAAMMVFAMTCTAFAAEPTKIGTPETPIADDKQASMEGHTFTAYQIFKGEQGEGDDHTITKIDWGSGINAEAFLAALKADETIGDQFTGITFVANASEETGVNRSADAVARVVAGWGDDTDYARAFARIADENKTDVGIAVGNTLTAGYYLVVDTTDFGEGFEGDQVKNLSVLQMTAEHTFEPQSKTGVPTLEKKVKEVNDSAVVVDEWGDVADYDIGDDVEFRLTGTLPADYDTYKTYKYVFHDKLNENLTFNNDVKVTIVNGETATELPAGNYELGGATDKDSFTVTIANLKALTGVTIDANTKIVVTYTAKLTGNNIIYGTGIDNTAYLEYSNNPNPDGEGDTGNTPDDKVVVFTFKMVVNKVDGEENPLQGAEFTLYKMEKQEGSDELTEGKTWKAVVSGGKGSIFTFDALDAGEYKLVETKVPTGYNKAEDMYFTVTATYTEDEVPEIETLTVSDVRDKDGNVIKKIDNADENAFTITATTENATLDTTVVNLQGILLPSTGGIGTTIFYVIGGILVVGAGVLLVIRKRMSKAE